MGNMYPDTVTMNPLLGSCLHDCSYCYRNGIMWRFKEDGKGKVNQWRRYHGMPRLDPDFNWQKALGGKPKTVFVCSMTDLFAKNVSDVIREEVVIRCRIDFPQHEYLWHTKNPAAFERVYEYPVTSTLATTIETNRDTSLISCAPLPCDRLERLLNVQSRTVGGVHYGESWGLSPGVFDIRWEVKPKIMIGIEPVMDFDLDDFLQIIETIAPDIVSIGADTGHNGLSEPSQEKLEYLVGTLTESVPDVRIKKNLRRLWPDAEVT